MDDYFVRGRHGGCFDGQPSFSRPLLDGSQGKQDGTKRLLQSIDVDCDGQWEGRQRRPRSMAKRVKPENGGTKASGGFSIASKVRDVHTKRVQVRRQKEQTLMMLRLSQPSR